MPRPRDTSELREWKRRELREALLQTTEYLWDECWDDHNGGPTLRDAAYHTGYQTKALEKALARLGIRWSEVKNLARRNVATRRLNGRFSSVSGGSHELANS